MGALPDTAIQINFKVGNDLINVYAKDGIDLQQLLSELGEQAGAIGEARTLLGGVAALAPLGPVQAQAAPAAYPAQQAPSGAPEPAEAEFCQHGKMTYKSGISKTGNNYALWECPTGLKAEQGGCAVRWPKRGR